MCIHLKKKTNCSNSTCMFVWIPCHHHCPWTPVVFSVGKYDMEPWNFEGIRNWMGGGRKWKKMHSVVRKIDTLTHISMTQVDPNIIVIWVSNLETHMSMTQIDPHAIVIWVSNLEWLINRVSNIKISHYTRSTNIVNPHCNT